MANNCITSRAFNQQIGTAKRRAESGPLIITDRGEPAHVFMAYEEYQRLVTMDGKTITDLLRIEGDIDIDLYGDLIKGGESIAGGFSSVRARE